MFVLNTVLAYANDLKSWFVFLEEFGVAWNTATSAHLNSFLEFLSGAISPTTGVEYAVSTINRRRMIIAKMYEFWRKQNLECAVPGSLLSEPDLSKKAKGKARRPVKILTPIQQQTLLNALGCEPKKWIPEDASKSSRNRLYGDIALITGMRISEIYSLKVSQFTGFANVDLVETELYPVNVRRKGGLVKSVLFSGDLISEILDYIEGERSFILNSLNIKSNSLILNSLSVHSHKGRPPSVRTIQREFSETCIKLGFTEVVECTSFVMKSSDEIISDTFSKIVSKYVFHDLRHTFAVTTYYALKFAGDEEPWMTLADRLGHADPRTTISIYLAGTKTFEGRVTDRFMEAIRREV